MSGPVLIPAEFVLLSQHAQAIGLVVTCLRPHLGSGGAAYEVELWEPGGKLWARATWASASLVREMIGEYAERCVRGDLGGRVAGLVR